MQAPRRGKAFSAPYAVPDTGPIDPFDLFCACLMGLMPDGSYRGGGLGEAAKHLRRSPNELRQMLQDYGMDPETLKQVDFDLSLARLDIQVAPEGIDRRELARGLFEEFCDLHPTLTCGPAPAPGGNGARPEAPPHPAHPHAHGKREAAPEPEAGDVEVEEEEAGPADAEPMAEEAGDEVDGEAAEEADEEPMEEDEEPLATVDAGVTRGAPTHGERSGRPVRQIRRSPTRRGR